MPVNKETLIELTAEIASAHVSRNNVAVGQLAGMIENIYAALDRLGRASEPVEEKPKGAVSLRASIKPDHLVSMIDGKRYKSLKRHIGLHGYTPESYRETFGLPRDYPIVAASYAEFRRDLAKKIGLGRKPKEASKPPRMPRTIKAEALRTSALDPSPESHDLGDK